jgi:asparagine synthase (glutamine-hydrolysing)
MCGIVGKLNFDGRPVAEELLKRMCAVSTHRGPDDEGIYLQGAIGLGHRRLSIIDLGCGHQPMSNEDGTIWIVFNGEIYNFLELRQELEARGHTLRTSSDTEVIVHLYEDYETACVKKLNGMFAFAIWDEPRQRLFLARDRLGKKPLHYAQVGQSLIFASEIQPILEDPTVPRRLNLKALDQYLTLLYVPGPYTMFQDIMKLPPAHFMVYEKGQARITRYWRLNFRHKLTLSQEALREHILALLEDATRLRLISDVPLGAFLSGGIDSSLIVALMSRLMNRPVKTFSVGFETEGDWFHELPYARLVAQHLGTDHTEIIIRPQMAEVLPKLVWHYGEPFGDSSSIPTYYISKVARSDVTVALSGDGGDELFGGYSWYTHYQALTAGQVLRTLTNQTLLDFKALAKSLSSNTAKAVLVRLLKRVLDLFKGEHDPVRRYTRLVQYFSNEQKRHLYSKALNQALGDTDGFEAFYKAATLTDGLHRLDRLFYIDINVYLPDDILVKVDIASMANSLEVRSPFLDYRVVELAASIPANLKVNNGTTKYILKRAARDLLPEAILTRPKWGFHSPIDDWLHKDLYQHTYEVLLDQHTQERGLFNVEYVKQMLKEYIAGKVYLGQHLWLFLNFELWCRTFLDGPSAPVTL